MSHKSHTTTKDFNTKTFRAEMVAYSNKYDRIISNKQGGSQDNKQSDKAYKPIHSYPVDDFLDRDHDYHFFND